MIMRPYFSEKELKCAEYYKYFSDTQTKTQSYYLKSNP